MLLRSESHDVVKVLTTHHGKGVLMESLWISANYPEAEIIKQSLVSLDVVPGLEKTEFEGAPFDVVEILLQTEKAKTIYFEISSFMS